MRRKIQYKFRSNKSVTWKRLNIVCYLLFFQLSGVFVLFNYFIENTKSIFIYFLFFNVSLLRVLTSKFIEKFNLNEN